MIGAERQARYRTTHAAIPRAPVCREEGQTAYSGKWRAAHRTKAARRFRATTLMAEDSATNIVSYFLAEAASALGLREDD